MDALFLEKLLLLLSQSSFTTTYKYAVLLTLIDLCVEGAVDGAAPADRFPAQVRRSHPVQYRQAIARVGWIALRDKRDRLVSAPLVRRWTERPEGALARIADAAEWPFSRERTRRTGAVVYRHLSPGTPVWSGVKRMDTLAETDRASILGALLG